MKTPRSHRPPAAQHRPERRQSLAQRSWHVVHQHRPSLQLRLPEPSAARAGGTRVVFPGTQQEPSSLSSPLRLQNTQGRQPAPARVKEQRHFSSTITPLSSLRLLPSTTPQSPSHCQPRDPGQKGWPRRAAPAICPWAQAAAVLELTHIPGRVQPNPSKAQPRRCFSRAPS